MHVILSKAKDLARKAMIASVTELHLKNFWSYIRFLPLAIKSKIQAERSPGLISLQLGSKGLFIQRTLTVWKSEKLMHDYVRSGSHLRAMKTFSQIANRSSTATFAVKSLPTWREALEKLKTEGKFHG
jgi:hypothetical protein